MTNHKSLIDVTGLELPFFHKREGKPKIDHRAGLFESRLTLTQD